jgi:hypothetical protein
VKTLGRRKGGSQGVSPWSFKEHMKSAVKTSGRRRGGSQGVSPWSFRKHTEAGSEDVGQKGRGVPGWSFKGHIEVDMFRLVRRPPEDNILSSKIT